MQEWTEEKLKEAGYSITNAKITSADIVLTDHGFLYIELQIKCSHFIFLYSFEIGSANEKILDKYPKLNEFIAKLFVVTDVSSFNDLNGTYIRVAYKEGAQLYKIETSSIIGNIIEDKWLDKDKIFVEEDK